MTTPRIHPAALRLAFLGLGLGLGLLLLGASPARADDAPPRHAVPEGRPIQLDGRPLVAEWSAALVLPLGDGRSKLKLMQYRGTLLVAFESGLTWTPRTSLTLYFAPEGAKGGTEAPGATWIAYEPFAHDRAHVFAFHKSSGQSGPDGFVRVEDRIVVRRSLGADGCALEMAFGLDVLGITKDARTPLRFCAFWPQPTAKGATWPAGLDFTGKGGRQRPPALATTEKWGTLDGWGDPTGPGAFPQSEWKTWIEADREITHRGRDAHAEVNLLIEEWKATRKQDSEFEKSVLDEFAWLARRERLTGADLIAVGTTLRFLNRHERALGMFDALVNHPDAAVAKYALWQRAQTHESAERFEAAAADWQELAGRGDGPSNARYAKRAEEARGLQVKWEAEQKRRAEDAAKGDLPQVALHTNRGVIVIQLFAKDVPKAVEHFLGLVASKFYDGTCFHRVLGEYMAQGGDPKSRELGCAFAGSGTSGREIELEMNGRHDFWRGALGFANKAHDPRNGSQFFIMTAPKPGLGKFTCFGSVVQGQAVADRLEYEDTLIRAEIVRR